MAVIEPPHALIDPLAGPAEEPCPENLWLICLGSGQEYFCFTPCGQADGCSCARHFGFGSPDSALIAYAQKDLIPVPSTDSHRHEGHSLRSARAIAQRQGQPYLLIFMDAAQSVRLLAIESDASDGGEQDQAGADSGG